MPVPVVVTGADEVVGALVIDRLAGQGLDLRATVSTRDAVGPLVARGVKTAVSDLRDTERFGAILEGAHTVIHVRELLAAVETLPDVVAALPDSGVSRVVTVAPLGRSHSALDELRASGVDVVLLRAVGLVGGRAVSGAIRADDLADALVAADRLRGLHGWTELDAVGPDTVEAGALRRVLFGFTRPAGDGGEALHRVLGVRTRSVQP
jgi:hypothetical protein